MNEERGGELANYWPQLAIGSLSFIGHWPGGGEVSEITIGTLSTRRIYLPDPNYSPQSHGTDKIRVIFLINRSGIGQYDYLH